MDEKEVVSALRANLADKLGRERFDLWLGAQSRLRLDGGTLLVELPSRFVQDWVRSHYRREIETVAERVLGQSPSIEFRIEASLSSKTDCSQSPCGGPSHKSSDANGVRTAAVLEPPRSPDVVAQQASLNEVVAQTFRLAKTDNGRDALLHRPIATIESFIVGQSNRLAQASAEMAIDQPGRVSPLFVSGTSGVGKTHLLEAVCDGARRRHPGLNAVYLSSEQFTTSFVEALRGSGLPSFRRKVRGAGLLAIDDIQFLSGKRATIAELLVTIDDLLRKGGQVVLSADRSLAALREMSDELAGRLSAGMTCEIDRPDYQTRLAILRQLAKRIDFELSDDVAEFVASHLTSNARELAGALNRLDAAARISRQPVTRGMAEEALAELIRHDMRPLRLADIEKAVCDVFGLEAEALQSGRRGKTVLQPRMLAMYLARKHTRAALSEIGQHFGRRSHSTVISAQKAVSGWMAAQSKIELTGKTWCVEEAIRRVEEKLRRA